MLPSIFTFSATQSGRDTESIPQPAEDHGAATCHQNQLTGLAARQNAAGGQGTRGLDATATAQQFRQFSVQNSAGENQGAVGQPGTGGQPSAAVHQQVPANSGQSRPADSDTRTRPDPAAQGAGTHVPAHQTVTGQQQPVNNHQAVAANQNQHRTAQFPDYGKQQPCKPSFLEMAGYFAGQLTACLMDPCARFGPLMGGCTCFGGAWNQPSFFDTSRFGYGRYCPDYGMPCMPQFEFNIGFPSFFGGHHHHAFPFGFF